jgi:hypothetical protein
MNFINSITNNKTYCTTTYSVCFNQAALVIVRLVHNKIKITNKPVLL